MSIRETCTGSSAITGRNSLFLQKKPQVICTVYTINDPYNGKILRKLEKEEAVIDGVRVTLAEYKYYADGNLKTKTEYFENSAHGANRVGHEFSLRLLPGGNKVPGTLDWCFHISRPMSRKFNNQEAGDRIYL